MSRNLCSVLIVLLLIVGCSRSEPESTGEDYFARAQQLLQSASGDKRLQLVSLGSEPRRRFTNFVKEDHKEHGTMRMKMGMSMKVDGVGAPESTLPVMVMPFRAEVGEKKNGLYEAIISYGMPDLEETEGLDEGMVMAMRHGLQAMADLQILLVMEENGSPVEAKMMNEESLPPQLRGNMEHMIRSFKDLFIEWPEEELGVGAEFIHVVPEIAFGGIRQQMKVLYNITDISDEGLALEVVTQSVMPEQQMDGESFGGAEMSGGQVRIAPETAYFQGTMNMYFTRMLPSMHNAGESRVKMELSDMPGMEPGQTMVMETTTRMEISMQ